MTRSKIPKIMIGVIILVILYFLARKFGILKTNLAGPINGMTYSQGYVNGMKISDVNPTPYGYAWVSAAPPSIDGASRSVYKSPTGDFVVY